MGQDFVRIAELPQPKALFLLALVLAALKLFICKLSRQTLRLTERLTPIACKIADFPTKLMLILKETLMEQEIQPALALTALLIKALLLEHVHKLLLT